MQLLCIHDYNEIIFKDDNLDGKCKDTLTHYHELEQMFFFRLLMTLENIFWYHFFLRSHVQKIVNVAYVFINNS